MGPGRWVSDSDSMIAVVGIQRSRDDVNWEEAATRTDSTLSRVRLCRKSRFEVAESVDAVPLLTR